MQCVEDKSALEKNSIPCQTYAKTEDHVSNSNSISILDIPAQQKGNICAFHEQIHAFEDWVFVRLSSLVLAFDWTTTEKSLQFNRSTSTMYESEGSDTSILPFTSKTGQPVAQIRQKIFLFSSYL